MSNLFRLLTLLLLVGSFLVLAPTTNAARQTTRELLHSLGDERPASQLWDFAGVTTFVMSAESDPITPIWGALRVFEHLDDGYMITQKGGPHVIFGREHSCIDDPITAFMVHDVLPAQRETECGGKVMTKYIPLAPLDSHEFPSLLAAFQSAETEINYLPEYWYWDAVTTIRVGCPVSGWIEYRADGGRTPLVFDHCAFSKGFVMTGTGALHYNTGRFNLDVQLNGYQTCPVKYTRKGSDAFLTGTGNGVTLKDKGRVDAADFVKENQRKVQRPLRSR